MTSFTGDRPSRPLAVHAVGPPLDPCATATKNVPANVLGSMTAKTPETALGNTVDDDAALAADVSFRQFVAARWGALHRYAYLLTGDHHVAEDVVQIALEKCWQRWRSIRNESPEGYVRAAIANVAASRRRRRRLPESPLDDLVQPAAPGDLAENQALRSSLWLALATLPPRRRTIVVLRVWEDRSEAETARILGISVGAVKSQLSKAMAQLRRHPQIRSAVGLRLTPDNPPNSTTTEASR